MYRRLLSFVLVCLFTATARTAELPALPKIAPEGTAISFVIRDLSGLMRDPAALATLNQLSHSKTMQMLLGGADVDKAFEVVQYLMSRAGLKPKAWVDDVLGDFVMFGYMPAHEGNATQETGYLVIRPKRPESLQKLVDQLNTIQIESGELLPLREGEAHGIRYTVRPTKKEESGEAYTFHDGLFIFTTNEAAMKKLLDPARVSMNLNEQLATLGMSQERFAVLFQPRIFDREFAKGERDAASVSDRAFAKQFRTIWSKITTVGVALSLGEKIELRAAARWESPQAFTDTVYHDPRPATPRWALPKDATAAFGGTVAVKPLLEFVRPFLSDIGRIELDDLIKDVVGPAVGKNRLDLVMEELGPNWIATVSTPKDKHQLMPDWVVAVQLGTPKITLERRQELQKAVSDGIDFLAQNIRHHYNRTHTDQVRIIRTEQLETKLVTLMNDEGFATGWQPTFAVREDMILIGSNVKQVTQFSPTPSSTTPSVAVLSAQRTSAYLRAKKHDLAAYFARSNKSDVEKELAELDKLILLIELWDEIRLEVKTNATGGEVKLSGTLSVPVAKQP